MQINIFAVGEKEPSYVADFKQKILPRITFFKVNCKSFVDEKSMLNQLNSTKGHFIALDASAKQYSSFGFANLLEQHVGPISFIIGPSDGLSAQLKAKCHQLLSFSELTFPHMLVRVILLEQLYRAQCIKSNHPYAK